jgi:hypothetical protein
MDAVCPESLRLYASLLDRAALLAEAAAGAKLEGAEADADRATLLAEAAGGAKLEVAAADAVSPAHLRLYLSMLDSLLAGASEDPDSAPTRKAPGRVTSSEDPDSTPT